jgi:hypothetical protein
LEITSNTQTGFSKTRPYTKRKSTKIRKDTSLLHYLRGPIFPLVTLLLIFPRSQPFQDIFCGASQDQSIQTKTIPSWSEKTAATTPTPSSFEGTGSVGNYCATSQDLIQEQCKEAVVGWSSRKVRFGVCPLPRSKTDK